MYKSINGIQHLGVAVTDMDLSLNFFRRIMGMDVAFFDSIAAAPLMDIYTRNETITKRASMILNLQGGCAMEVIRPTSFEPVKAKFQIQIGDLGIFMGCVKCKSIEKSHAFVKQHSDHFVSQICKDPAGLSTFSIEDPDRNWFTFHEGGDWYTDLGLHSGGISGCVMGVSNIDQSMTLYQDLLGFDTVVYDETGVFDDFQSLAGGNKEVRRVKLTQRSKTLGGFAKVAAGTTIELVQVLRGEVNTIYSDRIWADTGFVHLGFDVKGMQQVGEDLKNAGFPFTCDSNEALSMGKTRVHCVYIDDPDNTWLELIEVYKIPIVEKWGLFLNVEKRDPKKPLPNFMLKALKFSRVK
jgi:catechol 2,3-dioxygenase-like lactoylglutathione lyase family enzyme